MGVRMFVAARTGLEGDLAQHDVLRVGHHTACDAGLTGSGGTVTIVLKHGFYNSFLQTSLHKNALADIIVSSNNPICPEKLFAVLS